MPCPVSKFQYPSAHFPVPHFRFPFPFPISQQIMTQKPLTRQNTTSPPIPMIPCGTSIHEPKRDHILVRGAPGRLRCTASEMRVRLRCISSRPSLTRSHWMSRPLISRSKDTYSGAAVPAQLNSRIRRLARATTNSVLYCCTSFLSQSSQSRIAFSMAFSSDMPLERRTNLPFTVEPFLSLHNVSKFNPPCVEVDA